MKTFHCLAGLPRSGSTFLGALLSQNPAVHVSANSALISLLHRMTEVWEQEEQTKAYSVKNQLNDTLFGASLGYYQHVAKPIIFDKSRAWPYNYPIAQVSFRNDAKILATVRSIPDILASFISLCRKNPTNYIDKFLSQNGIPITDENRCEFLVSKSGTVFECWDSLRHGWANHPDKILFVEYDTLVEKPQYELSRIYRFFDLPIHHHSYDNIVNLVPENDEVYGIHGMHQVRRKIEKSPNNALEILGPDLYERYQGSEFWRTT